MASYPNNPDNDTKAVPLTSVESGTECELVDIRKDWTTKGTPGKRRGRNRHGRGQRGHGHEKKSQREVMQRLLDLGLTKGCSFKVIQSSDRGPVLLEIRGTRIALGQTLASRILVKEE